MADSKTTESGSGKEFQVSEACGNFEEMSKLMQKCLGGEGSFDFRKMMEEMCCGKREAETK